MSVPARSGSQSVEKALLVLDCFAGDRSLALSDLAAESGLPLSTTHRILQALCRGEYLVRRADVYQVGPRVPALLPRTEPMLDEIMPHLYALAAGVGLVVSVGVERRFAVATVASARPPVDHTASRPSRDTEPLHATAMGKVLLAFSSDGPSAALRALGELESFTGWTATSYAELIGQLTAVRRRGFAVADQERTVGVRELAVPVAVDSAAIAALGVQARADRLTDDLVRRILPPLRRAAAEMGRRIQLRDRVS